MKNYKLLIISLCAALAGGCTASSSSDNKEDTYTAQSTKTVFDTVYAFSETNPDEDASKKHFEDSEKLLEKYNQLFDIYNNYDGLNNLKTVNDNAGKEPVKVDQSIIDMLNLAKKFYDYSDGEFDITIGSLLNVWHNYREEGIKLNESGAEGNLPTDEELKEASVHKGWDKVVIDDDADTVYITDPDVSIDVGGIAKGYAAELTAQQMEKEGMKSGYLNVGRNIRLVGKKADGTDWRIGVADPKGEQANGLVTIDEKDPVSVVTSGDYERYYVASDGKTYSHIIDPSTLYPAVLYHSVTIITPDSAAADCLSTTLFTMSVEEGKQVLKAYEEDSGNDVQAVWVMDPDKSQDEDGKESGDYFITYTDGLKDNLTFTQ